MKNLVLNLKKEYFLDIQSGSKKKEYRLLNEYWTKRIKEKSFDNLVIRMGYPKAGEKGKEIIFPYLGYRVEKIQHEHFGADAVWVYSFKLEEKKKEKKRTGFRGRQNRKGGVSL